MEWLEEPEENLDDITNENSRLKCIVDFCKTLCLIKFNPCAINN